MDELMKRSLRISQCMIVKNEEKNIEKALSWGKEMMWEQIVVDTGSTDRTVELAASMGAAIYHFPWTDDFAAAKNFAISKAGGEWIAFLDADEAFVPGDEKKLWRLLEKLGDEDFDSVAAGWMQLDDQGKVALAATQIRVFRNRPGLGYRRRIHEQLEYVDRTPLRVADVTKELSILHWGYCGQAGKEKRVSRRNFKLILKELEEHPEDYEMMGYMGDEYFADESWNEAKMWYLKSVSSMPPALDGQDQRSASTFLRLMDIINRFGENDGEMLAVYEKAAGLLPREADFDYILGSHFAGRGVYEKGAAYLGRAFEKLEQYGSYNRSMMLLGNLKEAYEKQAMCFLLSGQREEAVNACIPVLKADPYSAQALYILLKAYKGEKAGESVTPEDALKVLWKIYNPASLKDRFFLLKVSDKAEWKEMGNLIMNLCTKEEIRTLKGVQGGISFLLNPGSQTT